MSPAGTPALNEGRSVNPGYTGQGWWFLAPPRALNEGRSVNPGYTTFNAG